MKTFFLILIPLLLIDLFFIIYRLYKKLEIKRINSYEKKIGLEKDELTKLNQIIKKKSYGIFIASTIFIVIYSNFINIDIYSSSKFLDMLKTEMLYIFSMYLIYLTSASIFRYIKKVFSFIRGFLAGIKGEEN